MILILCLTPGVACRAQIRNSVRNRNDFDAFLSCPAIGPVNMTNSRLNDWIKANGGTPTGQLLQVDFLSGGFKIAPKGLYLSASIGGMFSTNNNTMTNLCGGFSIGKAIVSHRKWQSNLNVNYTHIRVLINNVVPSGITPNADYELQNNLDGIGLSTMNFFKLKSWRRYSLGCGVEYGAYMLATGNWFYGRWSGRSRTTTPRVPVSGVPSFDSTYTYAKFSLVFTVK